MKISHFLFVSVVSSLIACSNPSHRTQLTTLDSNMTESSQRFSEFVESDMKQANAVGIAVAVIKHGHIAFAKGFGRKKFDAADPITTDTLFDIESVTKTLTAVAAMTLVDSGRLDLDAPVTQYIPYFSVNPPYDSSTITVRQVLSMTASYPGKPTGFDQEHPPFDDSQASGLSAFFHYYPNVDLMIKPGTLWAYSNYGYALAGLLVEAASGSDYTTYVNEHVLKPAGMTQATFENSVAHVRDHSVVNFKDDSGVEQAIDLTSHPETYSPRPFGGLYASLTDVAHFAETMLQGGGKMLKASSVHAMTAPQVSKGAPGKYYGFGMHIYRGTFTGDVDHDDILAEGVGDGDAGNHTAVVLDAAKDFAVITMSNDGNYDGSRIIDKAFEIFLGQVRSPAPTVSDPTTWSAFVGTYNDPVRLGDMIVTLDHDHLKIRFPVVNYESELTSLPSQGSNVFLFTPPPSLITVPAGVPYAGAFWQEKIGDAARFLWNREFIAPRTNSFQTTQR